MHISTLTISFKSQIALPRKIRNFLGSDVVSIELNDEDEVVILPVHNLACSLSSYQKSSEIDFAQIKNQAWAFDQRLLSIAKL